MFRFKIIVQLESCYISTAFMANPFIINFNTLKFATRFVCMFLMPVLLFSCDSSHNNEPSKNTDSILASEIQKEFLNLNTYYHKSYALKWTTGAIAAHAPYDIHVNLDKIESYIDKLPGEQATLIIRLILAHEFIHLIQNEKPVLNSNGQQYKIRILESQADMLAARYALLKYYQDKKIGNKSLLEENFTETKFIKAYEFFFKIGSATNSNLDHPTQYQRASSIYRGIKYAKMEILTGMLDTKPESSDNSQQYNSIDSLIKKERKQLNVPAANMDPFEWSLSQAELICHGNPAYMKNLVRTYLKTHETKDKNGKVKFVVVSNELINDGKEDVKITLESRVAPFRDDSTSFFDNISFDENKYITVDLPANQGIRYSDTFYIPKDDKAFELIVAPDTNSLYSISGMQEPGINDRKIIDIKGLDDSIRITKFGDYIEKLNQAITKQNISKIITSFGMPSYHVDEIMNAQYIGIVPSSEHFISEVSYDLRFPGQYKVQLVFSKTTDSAEALAIYNNCITRLSKCLELQKGEPKEWKRSTIAFYKKTISFKSVNHPLNINYLTFEHVTMPLGIHPFNMIKGDKFRRSAYLPDDYYTVYLTIRQWPDWSKEKYFPVPL